MQVEDITWIGLASWWSANDQRDVAVGFGVFRQVVIDGSIQMNFFAPVCPRSDVNARDHRLVIGLLLAQLPVQLFNRSRWNQKRVVFVLFGERRQVFLQYYAGVIT